MKESSSATERVGRYQLLEPIGNGPNGAVWRAKVFGVAGFERQFAIKRFSPELTASASAAQALSSAARSYGSLEHPRIARMSEFGVAQGQTFTAVEMVTGLDAMRLIAESKLGGTGLAVGGALALISQAARAVGYAHGRGLSHLGLSPTNILVTADGDVKVTDFGILSATITARPVDTPRLAQRLGYLAPEQLAGETTSAATDVFVLGVIAYELVTSQRAYYGETPHQLAQAILAGPPTEPPLPRPIVRVLSRCLARSQFERFPDARAFADALDAALRVAPVPGTRKDIGAQVKAAMDRHAAMNEGMLSGVVAINIGSLRPPASSHEPEGLATTEFVRPDVPVAGPPPLVGPRDVSPASTLPDLQRQLLTTTVPGLVPPPPIPVPPGVAAPQPPPIPAPGNAPHTMLGMSAMKRPQMPAVIAQIKPRAGTNGPTAPTAPTAPRGLLGPDRVAGASATRLGGLDRPASRAEKDKDAASTLADVTISDDDLETNLEDVLEPADEPKTEPFEAILPHPPEPRSPTDTSPSIEVLREPDTGAAIAIARTGTDSSPPFKGDQPTGEMAPEFMRELNRVARLNTRDLPGPPDAAGSPSRAPTSQPTSRAQSPTSPPAFCSYNRPRRRPSSRAQSPTSPPASSPHDVPSIAPTGRGGSPPIGYASSSAPHARMPSPSPPSLVGPPATQATELHLAPPPPRPQPQPNVQSSYVQAPPLATPRPQRWPLIAGVIVLAAAGIGIFVWQMKEAGDDSNVTVADRNGKTGSGSAGARTSGATSGSGHGSGTSIAIASGSGTATAASGSGTSHVSGVPGVAAGSGTSVPASGSGTSGTSSASGSGTSHGSGASAGSGTSVAASGSGTSAASGSGTSMPVTKTHVAPTGSSDALQITSTPPGARVFIDGADQGVTPVKLSGSGDRHTMALLLAGHELYVADVDGHGAFSIQLKAVTPPGGPAGVKVIKCKDKDRYYVSIDGKPTGMTCPTERIDCELGPHTVEVYDIVTETRRTFDIKVTDTRLSYRVRVD